MAHNCYMPEFPMIDNAKRFSALRNWSKGVFTLKHIKAHPLGILCIAFDGKHIAVGLIFFNHRRGVLIVLVEYLMFGTDNACIP